MDYKYIECIITERFKKDAVVIRFVLIMILLFLICWNQVFYIEDYIVLGVNSFLIAVGLLFGDKLL